MSLTNTAGAAVVLGNGAKLTDSAALSGAANPGGYILFTLTAPNGSTVDVEIANVTGNGTYTAPNGYVPNTIGTYQWSASYSGDTNNQGMSNSSASEKVNAATTPTLTTKPGATVVVGSGAKLTDSATLKRGSSPTGTLTFYLFPPGVATNATGTGSVYSDQLSVKGNGTYNTAAGTSTGSAVPTQAGTYQWVVVYSGDNKNNAATVPSTGTSASEKVNAVSPKVTVTPGAAVVVGSGATMTATAALSSGLKPGGYILFALTAPSGSIMDQEIVPTGGINGTYVTPSGYSPTTAGIYRWVASYSGDGNNSAATSAAHTAIATSGTTTPRLTVKTGGIALLGTGSPLTASATLAGGTNPTGTITFYLFAPGTTPNSTGSGSVYSSTVTVSRNGTHNSTSGTSTGSAVPKLTGSYQWVAVYGGDANNNTVSSTVIAEVVRAMPAGSRWGRG